MGNKVESDFLFARPSFLSGAAGVLDMWGQLPAYNESENPAQADANAIHSDWCVIGQDIYDAAGQLSLDGEAA